MASMTLTLGVSMSEATTVLQSRGGGPPSLGPAELIVLAVMWLPVAVLSVVSMVAAWRVYAKAGRPGWGVLIPIYNCLLLLEIVGRPAWWIVLFFIPFANLVATVMVAIDLAESFGRSAAFGVVLLWLFSFVGLLILGFGSASYVGPARQRSA
ncbi:MAG: DUF5684 domain-containing protein [Chloroflexota bacterium]